MRTSAERAPHCLAFFAVCAEIDLILAGGWVHATPELDESSLSILCYREPGDHINWHYDHNFYRGCHFTVLLSLRNESAAGTLPQPSGRDRVGDVVVDTSPNVLVVFEGARVLEPPARNRAMMPVKHDVLLRTNNVQEVCRRVRHRACGSVQLAMNRGRREPEFTR